MAAAGRRRSGFRVPPVSTTAIAGVRALTAAASVLAVAVSSLTPEVSAQAALCFADDNEWDISLAEADAIAAAAEYNDERCPDGWTFWCSHCYKVSDEELQLAQHQAACENDAAAAGLSESTGNVASVHSQAELDTIIVVIERADLTSWVLLGAQKTSDWHWLDGSAWEFEAWMPGEPNNHGGGEDILSMRVNVASPGFNDLDGRAAPAVCKAAPLAPPAGVVVPAHATCNAALSVPVAEDPRDPADAITVQCPSGFTQIECECYAVSRAEAGGMGTARAACRECGGDLATFRSAIQWNAAFDLAAGETLWIGGHYVDGTFHWMDETPFEFTRWASDEPNGHGREPCMTMNQLGIDAESNWNDNGCDKIAVRGLCRVHPSRFAPACRCPVGWTYWEQAEACFGVLEADSVGDGLPGACDRCSATPASIHSSEQNALLASSFLVPRASVFSGAMYLEEGADGDGGWTWADGSPWDYTNWDGTPASGDTRASLAPDALWHSESVAAEGEQGYVVCAADPDVIGALASDTFNACTSVHVEGWPLWPWLTPLLVMTSLYLWVCWGQILCPCLCCCCGRGHRRRTMWSTAHLDDVTRLTEARGGPRWDGLPCSVVPAARQGDVEEGGGLRACGDFATDKARGPWILVLAYARHNNENEALDYGRLPQSPYGYSHVTVGDLGRMAGVRLSSGDIDEVRFYGHSSQHGRVVHFASSAPSVKRMALTGTSGAGPNGAMHWSGCSSKWRPLPGHTAHLPARAASMVWVPYNWAFPLNHAFYAPGKHHWNIRTEDTRWEVDDSNQVLYSATLHQMWVRFKPGVFRITYNSGPYVKEVTRDDRTGSLQVMRQPSLDEDTINAMARPEELPKELQAYLLSERPSETECFYCEGTGKRSVAMANVYGASLSKETGAALAAAAAGAVKEAKHHVAEPPQEPPATVRTTSGRAIGKPRQKQLERCWVCRGTGKTQAMVLGSYAYRRRGGGAEEAKGSGTVGGGVAGDGGSADDDPDDSDDEDCCEICWTDKPEFGISTECAHFYCADCIRDHLETILRNGTSPAFCPGCAGAAPDGKPSAGRIRGRAITYLEQKGVIDKEFQFRFMKLQREHEQLWFKCPAKCGRFLVDKDPSFEVRGMELMVTVERCPCGRGVCVQCHQLVDDEHMDTHVCPEAKRARLSDDEAAIKLMAAMGKKCPKCNMFVVKDGGCDFMMCGTSAHGKLYDAISNGGCGHNFSWSSGKPAPTFFRNLKGERVTGDPAEMYPAEIKALKKKLGIKPPAFTPQAPKSGGGAAAGAGKEHK